MIGSVVPTSWIESRPSFASLTASDTAFEVCR